MKHLHTIRGLHTLLGDIGVQSDKCAAYAKGRVVKERGSLGRRYSSSTILLVPKAYAIRSM